MELSVLSDTLHNGKLSEWFEVSSDSGQGDIQSLPPFNVCFNVAAERTESNKVVSHGAVIQKYISPLVNDITVLDTDYEDDMAVLDNSDLLCMHGARGGVRINGKRTEAIIIGKATSQRPYTKEVTVNITVKDTPVQQVSRLMVVSRRARAAGDFILYSDFT